MSRCGYVDVTWHGSFQRKQTNANQCKPVQTRASALFFACIPASILAMGGSSKFYDASSNYGPGFLNTQEWLFFFALPLLELLLAIALIAFTRLAILPAFAMYSTFLGFLFATEISGVVECNCFGSIESHVRIIAALDLLALSALLISAKIVWTASPYVGRMFNSNATASHLRRGKILKNWYR